MNSLVSPAPSKFRSANKHVVVHGLIAGLLKGEWTGGDRLTEVEACERYHVSRTPVREALLEMRGLGLIELHRNRGAVFNSFGPDELREIYAVRSLLEIEATRLATRRMDRARIAAMMDGFRRIREGGGVDSDWRHDREFHNSVARASGNRRLATEIGRYGDLVQAVREIVGARALDIHGTTADEHLTILEAMAAGDAAAAAEAMRAHLAQACESAAAALISMRQG
jgi:DNA-binding GntR family transcriptional regulator